MPAQYVKAYIKRNKHDAADAEVICEAVQRPTMRFVPVKTADSKLPASIVIIGFLPDYKRSTPGLTPGLAGRNRVGGTMGECDALARRACELVHTAGVAQAL